MQKTPIIQHQTRNPIDSPDIEVLRTYQMHLSFSAPSKISSLSPEMVKPTKILSAPGLEDDYYLNLLDCSPVNKLVALGLKRKLLVWNVATEEGRLLGGVGEDNVGSVAWRSDVTLAVGTAKGSIQLWDTETGRKIRGKEVSCQRISVVGWNGQVLSSGGRDRALRHYDPRTPKLLINVVKEAHRGEICGLAWDQRTGKLATGGNDNQLLIWDASGSSAPIFKLNEHTAAVKAIAWSPHQRGLLVSGGGTNDRSLKFWSLISPTPTTSQRTFPTSSQVCDLIWSPHTMELVSAHGFCEHECIKWSWPSMEKKALCRGHEQRVLFVRELDGMLISGSADQTLRLWNVFANKDGKANRRNSVIFDDFF